MQPTSVWLYVAAVLEAHRFGTRAGPHGTPAVRMSGALAAPAGESVLRAQVSGITPHAVRATARAARPAPG